MFGRGLAFKTYDYNRLISASAGLCEVCTQRLPKWLGVEVGGERKTWKDWEGWKGEGVRCEAAAPSMQSGGTATLATVAT